MSMKRLLPALFQLLLGACTAQISDYDMNKQWKFTADDGRSAVVDLPHDAMLDATRSADAPGGGGEAYYTGGCYTYEKSLDVPAEWLDRCVTLHFDGVYCRSKVYVNGTEAGGAAYGYIPFDVPMDGLLREGTNTIRVEVDNSRQPNSRWYSGGGIYRPVTLSVVPKEHICAVRVKTVSTSPAVIEVAVDKTAGAGEASVEILDGKKVVAGGAPGPFTLPSARLWSAETPHLYTARVSLKNGDIREETFGIREIRWSPEGFFVNGQNVLLKGGCIHHDNGILGAAEYGEAAFRKIARLKEYGFNAIRSAHNPASQALLKACDELGMYVMDELWDMWFQPKTDGDYSHEFRDGYVADMEALVAHDYNHPCVVMYSIGNELGEPVSEEGPAFTRDIVDRMHALDPTRPVTAGANLMIMGVNAMGLTIMDLLAGAPVSAQAGKFSSLQFNEMMTDAFQFLSPDGLKVPALDKLVSPFLDRLDLAGYNYGSSRYELEGELHPDRLIVGSETYPPDIWRNWQQVKRLPYLIGDFMWTAWDYLGEAGAGAWTYEEDERGFTKPFPWKMAQAGALDLLGNPTGEAFHALVTWEEKPGKPHLAVRPILDKEPFPSQWRGTNSIPNWSWRGAEGKTATVEVYSSADRVELFLNGEKVGEGTVEGGCCLFQIPYSPGRLQAKAYAGDTLCGEDELVSAEGPLSVQLMPEKKAVAPGTLVFVDVVLAGENGAAESFADTALTLTVEGGRLVGFGSAKPSTLDRFTSGTYHTHYGRALAAVYADRPGTITLTCSGDGVQTGTVSISCK